MPKPSKKKLAEVSAGFKSNVGRAQVRKLVGSKPQVIKNKKEKPRGQSVTGSRFKRSGK